MLRILRGCHVEKDLWPALLGQILRNCLFGKRVLRDCCVEKVSEVLLCWVGF